MPTVQGFAIGATSPAAHADGEQRGRVRYDYVKRPVPPSIGAFEP